MLINIKPKLWGGSFWKTMHYVTLAYPDNPTAEDKANIMAFFTSIKNVLPCETCRHHLDLNLKKYPLDDTVLSSRQNLIKWLVDLHNEVNIRTGTKLITVNDIMVGYFNDKETDWIKITTVILMIILIIIFIYFARLTY